MPGIIRSVSSTETGSRRRISSASPPEPAVSTRSDSRSKIFCSESTIAGSSSTTRTVGAPRLSRHHVHRPSCLQLRMPSLAEIAVTH